MIIIAVSVGLFELFHRLEENQNISSEELSAEPEVNLEE
jgi:hypothetical protein